MREMSFPPEICSELGSVLHTKHCTPFLREASTMFFPCSSSLLGSSLIFYPGHIKRQTRTAHNWWSRRRGHTGS